MQNLVTSTNLYEQDYCLWLETTVKFLKNGQLHQLDLEHLIEEIEDMGRNEKNALESNLRVILIYLLKYKYQPEKCTNNWLSTIREHRTRIRKLFRNSPSLKRYFEEIFAECYQDAKPIAADEIGLPKDTFPEVSPFSLEQILDEEYLPK